MGKQYELEFLITFFFKLKELDFTDLHFIRNISSSLSLPVFVFKPHDRCYHFVSACEQHIEFCLLMKGSKCQTRFFNSFSCKTYGKTVISSWYSHYLLIANIVTKKVDCFFANLKNGTIWKRITKCSFISINEKLFPKFRYSSLLLEDWALLSQITDVLIIDCDHPPSHVYPSVKLAHFPTE